MSTQNERELFRAMMVEKYHVPDDDECFDDDSEMNDDFAFWEESRAPLLSRIEWLEAEKHSWKTYAKGLYSRIDALSKDAERLDWMILHSATVLHTSDAEHCSVKWGNNQTDLHDSAREAIDAAIGAREWE